MATREKAREFPLDIEQGPHISRCIRFIDMGTIEGTYMGEKTIGRKLMFTYECPKVLKEWKKGEPKKPVLVSRVFSFYMT